MKRCVDVRAVWVTTPSRRVAERIAKSALTDRLVACANLIPGVESHYWWKGNLEKSREWLVVMKTTTRRLRELEKRVMELHPYDTPAFVVFPLVAGSDRYLEWVRVETRRK